MSNLLDDVLIGTDLWAKFEIPLCLPKLITVTKPIQTATIHPVAESLATRNSEEEHRLQEFLKEELAKFDGITGSTPYVQHRILLKSGVEPVKQRYRPRNSAMQAIINREVA